MRALDDKKIKELFVPLLFLVLGYIITVSYFAVYGDNLVTSDSAADLILARLLNQEGAFVSPNWYYSTELILIDTQLIYKPALALFPGDWHTARLLGLAVLMAIYLIGMIFVVKSAGIGIKGLWAAAVCAFPIGLDYVLSISWGALNIPNTVFSFILIGTLLSAIRSKDRKPVYISLLAVFSFLAGLRTVRTILQICLPLLAAGIIMLLCRSLRNVLKIGPSKIRDTDKALTGYSVIMLAASAAGYLVNSGILSHRYAFVNFNDAYWEPFSLHRMATVLSEFIASFGWHSGTGVFSLSGISSCFGLLLGIVVILSMLILYFKYSGCLNDTEYILVLFTLVSVLVSLVFFSLNGNYNAGHWIPLMPFCYLCASIALKYIAKNFALVRKTGFEIILGAAVLFTSLSFIVFPLPSNIDKTSLLPVISYLDEQGYTKGIATFWNSNITTELTDGRIEMWTVEDFDDMQIQTWLQEKSHDTLPEGRVFIILSAKELSGITADVEDYIILRTDDYTVLGFEEGTDYLSVITAKQ